MLFTPAFMFGNCKKSVSDHDELSIARQSYLGNQLRVDGFYYTEANGSLYSASFFYKNGVILDAGGTFNSVEEIDTYIQNEFILRNEYKKYMTNWGLFLIENKSIKFERWYPSSGGPMKAYVRAGSILNDTTFLINESYRNQNGKKSEAKERNETYHFRQFSPKPDSTNTFVP